MHYTTIDPHNVKDSNPRPYTNIDPKRQKFEPKTIAPQKPKAHVYRNDEKYAMVIDAVPAHVNPKAPV
jgi:hypothetical protein